MQNMIKNRVKKELSGPRLNLLSKMFKPFYSGIGSILMFHRVIPDEQELLCEDLEVTASYLEKIINYYRTQHYDFLSLDEAYERINNPDKLNKKFVVFTFDDGYLDNLTVAYPIFEKYQVPFTVYITTCFPDRTAILWWYALKDLINNNSHISFNHNNVKYDFKIESSYDKEAAYNTLRNMIVNTKIEELSNFINELFEDSGINIKDYVNSLAMDWNQIKFLSKTDLVTIGAHTTNHYNLRKLSKERLHFEVIDSKYKIETIINQEVKHFAYPFGTRNESSIREFKMLEELGFKTGTTTRCANIFPNHSSTLTSLPRLTLSPYMTTSHPQYYANGLLPAMSNNFRRVITD